MAASQELFNFMSSVLKFLPQEDIGRMAELYKGYEQIFASVYQKTVERSLNISIGDLLAYTTDRWLNYSFTSANQLIQPAIYTSNQDLSVGMNLSVRYLIRFSVDSGPEIEVNLQGANPLLTTIDEIIAIINAAAGFTFVSGIFDNTILQFASSTVGTSSRITFYPASVPTADASEFLLGLLPEDLPESFPKFPFIYTIPYPNVADIPTLQDFIRDESVTVSLVSGTDFSVNSNGTVSFATTPPEAMWAKRTLTDEQTPWNNYGFLLNIYEPNSPGYVQVLQGLWYAYWNGPQPQSILNAMYLLFGLPTAQEDTVVTLVTDTQIQTTSAAGVLRTFNIPTNLNAIVAVGDSVTKFTPLVDGISVFDKINSPNFIATQVGRAGIQRFLTQNATRGPGDTDETKALTMLLEHTWLPQITVDAFISPNINLGNVKTFLSAIQPLSKTFLFQVIVGDFADPIPYVEQDQESVDIDYTPTLDTNQTTFTDPTTLADYETTDNPALDLDSDCSLFTESVGIDVYQNGILQYTINA